MADRVSGMAKALRSAAQPLDESQNRVIARYLEAGAAQVEGLSRTIRERHWGELVADTEDFARRQPTWFVLGAVATGFGVGRILWASTRGRARGRPRWPPRHRPPRLARGAVL